MSSKAVFYHAGCPVCIDAEKNLAYSLDPARFKLEIVHLGENKGRVPEAIASGVKSVPALLLGDEVYHINFGASIDDLK
ncbi:thioredoxin [Andreprevotia chitinilytica]|uniref:thioredoxin n=1 Tax=Andreprevotia chitinilytica TaxID=396808 RepID=UPI000558937D|nr:thioredoxin [Andreprevotia chitinilytica]